MTTPLIYNPPLQTWTSASKSLKAFQTYNFRVEAHNASGGGAMKVKMSPPDINGSPTTTYNVELPLSNRSSPQVLQNPGFEGTFVGLYAPNWGQLDLWGIFNRTIPPPAQQLNTGLAAQKLPIYNVVPGSGGYVFGQKFNALKGHTYEASVWVMVGSDATAVSACEFYMRGENKDPNGPVYASRLGTQNLNSTNVPNDGKWRKFTIRGGSIRT